MNVFKPFLTSDTLISPFEVNKSFYYSDPDNLIIAGIGRYEGINILPEDSPLNPWISGSNNTGYYPQDRILVYRSIRELYYSNYLSGSNGSPVNTASFNNDGTITGEYYTPNYYNYLSSTLTASRYFPTGDRERIGVISIPSNLYGEHIQPGTLNLQGTSFSYTDDTNGNIFSGSQKVGDIIYEHGMAILTSASNHIIDEFVSGSNITASFSSSFKIYETQYKCTVRENEFNYTLNPTSTSGSTNSGVYRDFATGSYFTPYATTIGLYNNDYELIAVAKLAQPLPLSSVTDTTVLVNLDMFS